MAPIAFTAAMIQYFGKLPGQSAMDFGRELKALSYPERMEFAKMLRQQAKIDCTDPTDPNAATK